MRVHKSAVQTIVAAAFPAYRGRRFHLEAHDGGAMILGDEVWGGGSRNEYRAVVIADGSCSHASVQSPYAGGGTDRRTVIPTGVAVVEHTNFCGQDLGLTVHVRADEVTRWLPRTKDAA